MKFIFVSLFLTVLLALLGVLVINTNFSTTAIPIKNFYVVKFDGTSYPYELTFKIGTVLKEALAKIGVLDIKAIYEVENRKNVERTLNYEINRDSTFKVQF